MKILVIGDPHFKNNNLYFMNWACQEILELIDERKPDLCVCLGDTLDTHERVTLRPLHMATKFFFSIAEKCPLINIIGNHDRENNNDFLTDIHPFIGMTKTKNITIVDKPIWDHDKNFIYVPYVPPGKFQEALTHVGYYPDESAKQPDLIFCHQEFSGSNLNNGVYSTKGDSWSQDWPLIISGHIHEHQVLPKIIYVGTFIQQNYGESSDKAIMMIYEDKKIERIRLKSVCSRKTVKLTLKDLNNFSDKIPSDSIRSKDFKPSSELKEIIGGTLVRVQLHIDATETSTLKSNPQYKALEDMVDKVDIIPDSSKASLAGTLISQIKTDSETPNLVKIVQELLKDDPNSLKLFQTEILTQ